MCSKVAFVQSADESLLHAGYIPTYNNVDRHQTRTPTATRLTSKEKEKPTSILKRIMKMKHSDRKIAKSGLLKYCFKYHEQLLVS